MAPVTPVVGVLCLATVAMMGRVGIPVVIDHRVCMVKMLRAIRQRVPFVTGLILRAGGQRRVVISVMMGPIRSSN